VMIEGARLALTGLAVLSTGAWFGGVHDPRVLIGIECFSLLSLVWLWQAARAKPVAEAASAAA
jgi:hypothetical protein